MAEPTPPAARPKLVHAVVARGHTVHQGKPAIGGKPSTLKAFGPGSIIEVPADEVRHLTAHGFLTDPAAPAPPLGQGPTYGQDGNMVQTVGDGD